MKSDSERQIEYQKRRAETESRVTFWMSKDIETLSDELRGPESRATWINRAVTELTYRQLMGKRFDEIYSDEECAAARKKARKLGVILPR